MQSLFFLFSLAIVCGIVSISNGSTAEIPLVVLLNKLSSSIDPISWNKLMERLTDLGFNKKSCPHPLVFDSGTFKC